MELHIMDASQYIYAGSYTNMVISRGVRETDGAYHENCAPIGGVRFLVTQAAKLCADNRVVMPVFDRTPTIKREMYKNTFGLEYGYKGTRKAPDKGIHLQKDYAYDILCDVGFATQAAEDYESDDVIYTLVRMYKNDFEHIYIHCNDSDLYFLVDDTVSMDTVGDKTGKVINRSNFQNVVEKDGWCPYNVHHIRKLCKSDRSDNIPGVGSDWMPRLDSVIPASELCKLGDLDLCRDYLKKAIAAYPTAPNAHMLIQTFNILVPLEVPEYLINDSEPDINWEKLRYFTRGWKTEEDRWGFEDKLLEYIDRYYE